MEEMKATPEGEWLITDEEERRFFFSESFSGAECDVKNEEDMTASVKMLAVLHKSVKGFQEEMPELVRRNASTLTEVFEKHNRELRQIKNYIRGRKKKNAFEALFMQQYDDYYKKAAAVTAALTDKNMPQEASNG